MLCIVSTAAAEDMHLHTINFEQAFIQALGEWSSLPEGAPTCFIKQPSGWDGADALGPDAVLELCAPLYGHPAAAQCLFFMLQLNDFMTDLGFEKAGFDESVWVRKAGGRFQNKIVVGVHIDDSMIACCDLAELKDFKCLLLERFKGTNGGEITEYLGWAVVLDWKKKSITLHQSLYSQHSDILQLYCIDVEPVPGPAADVQR
eukprot:302121-Rhodomonas_salina.1